MFITKSENISVTVIPRFMPEQSSPYMRVFVHCYDVRIKNEAYDSVKILRRSWVVFDAASGVRLVDGIGLVGYQPIIRPGETFRYISSVEIYSEFGSMKGNYLAVNTTTGRQFDLAIPAFELIAPLINN